MLRPLFRLALACLVNMTLVLDAAAAPPAIWVALSGEDGVYAETAAVLRAELEPKATLSVGMPATLLDGKAARPALIVTVGAAAFDVTTKWLEQRDASWHGVPVLATLLPRAAYEKAREECTIPGHAMSAVVLDQPPDRQMALIRRALPQMQRVAVLLGPQTRPLLGELGRAAAARGIQLAATAEIGAPEGIFPALRQATSDADILLALPDPLIYNSSTLQNILLTGYRARVPLVGYSAAFVKAGALLAVYSTPAQVARHAAEVVRGWLAGRGLPPTQSPREFAVAANPRVAASLGLSLDDADVIAEDLRRAEGRR